MKAQLPPASKRPALWEKIYWIADPLDYMDTYARQYEDIFTNYILGANNPWIFVSHPQGIQKVLTDDIFEAPGSVNKILAPLTGDNSIFILEGDRHKRERKLLMPSFHGERMRDYGELITDITHQIMEKLPLKQTFIARDIMQAISLDVILKVVFGVYEGERYNQLKPLLSGMLDIGKSPLTSSFLFFPILQQNLGSWSPWGYFLKQRQKIDELLYAEIRERRENPDESRTDMLNLMIAARDEEGNPMTDQELRDELLTFLFAGHETTATAMAWALYWIHHQPEVYEKLMSELNSLSRDADGMEIFRLPYLTAVCQETLRIYPVGMLTFARTNKESVDLMGYQLPPKTPVVGCIYLTHRREDLYPQADQFKPERFLERKFSAYEFLPFGGGSRLCLGMALAQYEMKLVLATILLNYELHSLEKQPVKAVRRGITLAPKGGIKMELLNKRSQPPKPRVLVGTV
ncbi:putative cytochrome P450 110 [Planktothrix serta PCC 8927]|uniref:Cytochrome P450 110 n=1 Tax=Planktothrix serta PCC 8927 TaxID=671068 RepID=A0A7Z9DX07_9CYAN|nr:cytochrome P450 [Planktothrix serta]VXD15531.1 putative cytochrome P450 110 [Planktothrix serta PCC 8927]